MKVEIPEQLKADVPPTKWGKLLTATPVVMAVVATMLAGLSSSEMTRAQYDRSLAAQQQSKAGDQWGFFQAKRMRGALQHSSLDVLQGTVELRPVTAAALKQAAEQLPVEPDRAGAASVRTELLLALDSPAGQQALSCLEREELPWVGQPPTPEAAIKAALEAVENLKPDTEISALLTQVTDKALNDALRAAREQAQALDTATKPVNQTIDQLESALRRQEAARRTQSTTAITNAWLFAASASLSRDFTAARLRYAALRYEVEARLNQAIANLHELQVRKSNTSAARHHTRSQRFFYGMLAAQLGVIISTFAIAARQRNLLWSLAAAAGLLAVAFAIYVYLYV